MAEMLSYLLVLTEKLNISCFLSQKCHNNLNLWLLKTSKKSIIAVFTLLEIHLRFYILLWLGKFARICNELCYDVDSVEM
jgi:hypothetical protein